MCMRLLAGAGLLVYSCFQLFKLFILQIVSTQVRYPKCMLAECLPAEHSTLAHLWALLIATLRALLLLSPEPHSHTTTWYCCQKVISYAAPRDTLSAAFSSNLACFEAAEWGSPDCMTLHAAESGTLRWCQGQIVPRQNCTWQEVEMGRKTLNNLTSHYFIF